MHKFTRYDLAFLKGCELTQIILVTKWAVEFVFTDGTRLTVEREFEYVRKRDGCTFVYRLSEGIQPVYFHELMERTIASVEVSDYSLRLRFDSGDELNIKTDEENLEAGHINMPGSFIVF